MDDNEQPRYVFTVELVGHGTNVDEAWIDAVEALALDAGDPPEQHAFDMCIGHDSPSGRADVD
jgi:hypothetical protein